VSEEKPPEIPRVKTRLPFDEHAFSRKRNAQRGSAYLSAVLFVVFVGLTYYMAVVVGHPVMSPYVLGPALGVMWFGLRLFMMIVPRV
jgi:hypothetical protein